MDSEADLSTSYYRLNIYRYIYTHTPYRLKGEQLLHLNKFLSKRDIGAASDDALVQENIFSLHINLS